MIVYSSIHHCVLRILRRRRQSGRELEQVNLIMQRLGSRAARTIDSCLICVRTKPELNPLRQGY